MPCAVLPRPASATATTNRSGRSSSLAAAFAPSPGRPPRRLRPEPRPGGKPGLGDRLPPEARPLAAFCTLLAPFVPCCSWARSTARTAPFQFFSDHIDPEIAQATREGRRSEFASFTSFSREEIPDPQDPATFERSKLTRRSIQPARLYRELLNDRGESFRPATPMRSPSTRIGAGSGSGGPLRAACATSAQRDRLPCAEQPLRLITSADSRALDRAIPLAPLSGALLDTAAPRARMREVWPGRALPDGRHAGTGRERTSRSSPSTPRQWSCACLMSRAREERIQLTQRRALNWHCYLPGVGPGQRYGYRVHGTYSPTEGQRFNPAKLLIDPYAKAIEGVVDWAHDANVLPYVPDGRRGRRPGDRRRGRRGRDAQVGGDR